MSTKTNDVRPVYMQGRTREMLIACKEAMQHAGKSHKSVSSQAVAARQALVKSADYGANQGPAFEKAFGTIAFTYLQEKVPGLIPHVVGFQLLDRDEDGRKAIGVFVAKIGERIIDIPMFFINGELKGHQIMRIRQPEMFIPLREAFLDYLLSKLPQDLGETGPGISAPSPVRSTPEMSPFNGSRMMKRSEDLHHIADWAMELEVPQNYVAMRTDKLSLELGISALERSGKAQLFDLAGFVCGSESLLKTAAKLADQYPTFAAGMANRCGEDWVKVAAAKVIAAKTKAAQMRAPLPVPSLKLANVGINSDLPSVEYRQHPASYSSQLRMHKTADVAVLEEIQKFGDYVIDRRDGDKLAQAYKVERHEISIEPPIMSGVYTVFMQDGKGKDLIVIPSKERIPYDRRDMVIDLSAKKFALPGRMSYVCRQSNLEAMGPTFNLANTLKATNGRPKEGEMFILLDDRGRVAGPFRVEKKNSRGNFTIEDFSGDYRFTHGQTGSEICGDLPAPMLSTRSPRTLIYDDGLDSSVIRKVNDQLIAGKKVKMKVLATGLTPETSDSDWVPSSKYEAFKLDLLNHSVVSFDSLSKFSNLEIRRRHNSVDVNGVNLKLGAARRFLIDECSIAAKLATEMLTSDDDAARYVVTRPGEVPTLESLQKLAFPVPNTPQFPMEEQPYASESGRYMVEEPTYGMDESDPMPRREPLQPWEDPHDGMFQGQEGGQLPGAAGPDPAELFDVAGLISLVRNSRIDSDIRQTTKSLLQTIDRIGRLLFMFYTHSEEFENRYGESDVQDLESALISVFEGAGDLFITLTRRSNDPQPEMDMMDLPLDM